MSELQVGIEGARAAIKVVSEQSSALSEVIQGSRNAIRQVVDHATGLVKNELTMHGFPDAAKLLGEVTSGASTEAQLGAGTDFSGHKLETWLNKDGTTNRFRSVGPDDTSWHGIYESRFPADERQPYDFLKELSAEGAVPRVSTQITERDGKPATFSMLSDYGSGPEGQRLLLPYIATDENLQGMGIGSEHLKRLIADTKQQFPQAPGMVVEVEDPLAPGISAEDKAVREQRINWYVDRHGGQLLDRKYAIPSSEEGAPAIPGKLIWLDFGRSGASKKHMDSLISSIYKNGYELPEDHPVVADVLGKYSD